MVGLAMKLDSVSRSEKIIRLHRLLSPLHRGKEIIFIYRKLQAQPRVRHTDYASGDICHRNHNYIGVRALFLLL